MTDENRDNDARQSLEDWKVTVSDTQQGLRSCRRLNLRGV